MSTENAQETLNNIFINLKILSNLTEGDKLYKKNEHIIGIDKNHYLRSIDRWWHDRNGDNTLDFLREFISSTFTVIDSILLNELESVSSTYNYFKESNHSILQKFLLEFTNAVRGLQQLKITYNSDIIFKSTLDVLIEDIEFRNERIRECLKINVSRGNNPLKHI
jgi:hypothetical protein